ncbi:hypothetical protein QR680_000725 [Steinernema hermaphroditum]|uniref:Uncharacterized protein n=1 Tax=Steinernema hermaphroditum TaxID=289476 RepID=A0AA39GYG2_9BILA|nr:hypothetical protein QR680_000725 [Steinernema hermaphroditum]
MVEDVTVPDPETADRNPPAVVLVVAPIKSICVTFPCQRPTMWPFSHNHYAMPTSQAYPSMHSIRNTAEFDPSLSRVYSSHTTHLSHCSP